MNDNQPDKQNDVWGLITDEVFNDPKNNAMQNLFLK